VVKAAGVRLPFPVRRRIVAVGLGVGAVVGTGWGVEKTSMRIRK
jgi:hypothetical protein